MYIASQPQLTCYDDQSPYIPEQWALETIMVLEENMVVANLVHRDFENEFARFGDVVHTRKPNEFTAKSKDRTDDITVQDPSATDILVPLDQHIHVAYQLEDEPATKSFKSLMEEYAQPAGLALARAVDRAVLGTLYEFLPNMASTLGGLTTSNAVAAIVNTRKELNTTKSAVEGRRLVWGTNAEALVIQNAVFHEANKVGDEGTALREASLGRKLGFDHFMSQNTPSIAAQTGTGLQEINNAAGYVAGTTVMTVDGGASGELLAGQWITINGLPYHVTAVNADPATSITLEYGLKEAVADNDDITIYNGTAVDLVAGYAVGWRKPIVVDSVAKLNVGQAVTFEATTTRYAITEIEGLTIQLNKPLAVAISDGDTVNPTPTGDYNFAFNRSAVTLALRPLAAPAAGAGAISAVTSFNGIPMRVTIAYDHLKQRHVVTHDFLLGIKVLDTDKGAVVLT